MFARFRNLFSKHKTELETGETPENLMSVEFAENADTSASADVAYEGSTELEGLSFLKSLVENEQQSCAQEVAITSLSEEMTQLLEKSDLKNAENSERQEEHISNDSAQTNSQINKENNNHIFPEKVNHEDDFSTDLATQIKNVDSLNQPYVELAINESLVQKEQTVETENEMLQPEGNETAKDTSFKTNKYDFTETKNCLNDVTTTRLAELESHCENSSTYPSDGASSVANTTNKPHGSNSLSQAPVYENNAHSESNTCNTSSSIVVEDLPSEITIPSPTVESSISANSSNTSTLESSALSAVLDPSKIVINPINNNGLACNAITNKLSDIAEVAESLDAVIRDVQENVQLVEVELNACPSQKKLGALRSTSSEVSF